MYYDMNFLTIKNLDLKVRSKLCAAPVNEIMTALLVGNQIVGQQDGIFLND